MGSFDGRKKRIFTAIVSVGFLVLVADVLMLSGIDVPYKIHKAKGAPVSYPARPLVCIY
jgi:hypothetical protein